MSGIGPDGVTLIGLNLSLNFWSVGVDFAELLLMEPDSCLLPLSWLFF